YSSCGCTPTPTANAPCGSKSTSSTLRPYSASEAPRLIVDVVLPTPPFWLHMASTRAGPCSFTGGGVGISRNGRPVGPTRAWVPLVSAPLTWSTSSAPGLSVAVIVSGSNVDIARRLLAVAAVGSLSTGRGNEQSGSPLWPAIRPQIRSNRPHFRCLPLAYDQHRGIHPRGRVKRRTWQRPADARTPPSRYPRGIGEPAHDRALQHEIGGDHPGRRLQQLAQQLATDRVRRARHHPKRAPRQHEFAGVDTQHRHRLAGEAFLQFLCLSGARFVRQSTRTSGPH